MAVSRMVCCEVGERKSDFQVPLQALHPHPRSALYFFQRSHGPLNMIRETIPYSTQMEQSNDSTDPPKRVTEGCEVISGIAQTVT